MVVFAKWKPLKVAFGSLMVAGGKSMAEDKLMNCDLHVFPHGVLGGMSEIKKAFAGNDLLLSKALTVSD